MDDVNDQTGEREDSDTEDLPPRRWRDVRRTRADKRSAARYRGYLRVVSQESVQRLWSDVRAESPPRDIYAGNPDWTPVEFGQPATIVCGQCLKKLGAVVAYSAGDRAGLVEDTARWRSSPVGLDNDPPLYRGTKHHPHWFGIESTAGRTAIRFSCPQCLWGSKLADPHTLGASLLAEPPPKLIPE